MSDGTVSPSTAPISRSGNLYELTGDLNAELVVQKSDIVIDGNGYTLTGVSTDEGKGVYLREISNVTLRNMSISNFRYAVYLDNSSFNVITGLHLENQGDGIVLEPLCNYNTISSNTIVSTEYNSLFLGRSYYNTINGNTIINMSLAFDAYNSSYNSFFENHIVSSSGSPRVIFRDIANANGIYGNTGQPDIYVEGANNTIFDNDAGIITVTGGDYMGSSPRITASFNLVFRNNATGIRLGTYSDQNEIYENNIISQDDGIEIEKSTESNIVRDNVVKSQKNGITIHDTGLSRSTISGNVIISQEAGIYTDKCYYESSITSNTIFSYESSGIDLAYSLRSNITDNVIQASKCGIASNGDSRNMIISGNAIGNCEIGISLGYFSVLHVISNNSLTGNVFGMFLYGADRNIITGNAINHNVYGIYVESRYVDAWPRAGWYYSLNNTITGNLLSENVGSAIYINSSTNENVVTENDIVNNNFAVLIGDDCSDNVFYLNNFQNNNFTVDCYPWREIWYKLYTGGNYWSNYNGTDNNGDGTGDTEYVIDENNVDKYPLIDPVAVPVLDVPSPISETAPPYVPHSTVDFFSKAYIRSDGTVEPSNAPISRSGDLYEFTGDMNAELIVMKSNIVIDGKGYVIDGGDRKEDYGITLDGLTNVTIKNLGVTNFFHGIHLYHCSSNVIECNNLLNVSNGIVLDELCDDNIISNNTLNITVYNALYLGYSSFNTVSNNTIIDPINVALDSEEATYNYVLTNHIVSSSRYSAIQFSRTSHNNLIFGNDGQLDIKVAGENNTINENKGRNLYLYGSKTMNDEVYLSANNSVLHNVFTTISLKLASNNVLYGNTAESINIDDPSSNTVSGNTIVDPASVPTKPEEPEEPETPTEPESPEEPEQPTEPEEPETPNEPEQPTTEEPAISTELLVVVAVAAVCVIGVAAYWTQKHRK